MARAKRLSVDLISLNFQTYVVYYLVYVLANLTLNTYDPQPNSRARWLAPELIIPGRVPPPTEATDIWSFGSLCLEVFTGAEPYISYPDVYVPVLLSKGVIPEHPGPMAVGLTPMMWKLMQSCWNINPAKRPAMATVQSAIRQMLPHRVHESYAAALLRVTNAQMRRDDLEYAGYNVGVQTSHVAEARSARLTPPREQVDEGSWS